MIPILMAIDGPLINGPLNNEEISWVSSMFAVGTMLGSFLSSSLTAFVGSKHSTTFLVIPSIAFSTLTYFGNTFVHMMIGRLIGGVILGATLSSIAIYTSEISNDEYVRFILQLMHVSAFIAFHFQFLAYEVDLALSVHLVEMSECCFAFALVYFWNISTFQS